MAECSGIRVEGLRVQGLKLRVQALVCDFEVRVQGLGFRVYG